MYVSSHRKQRAGGDLRPAAGSSHGCSVTPWGVGWQGGGCCKLPCASLQIALASDTSLIYIFNNFIYLFESVLSLH